MSKKASIIEDVLEPKAQLNLLGYDSYFNFFVNLYEKSKLPNSILLTGQKGIGKSTFAYHFINYLLSKDEANKYDRKNYIINKENSSFKLIQNETHPNLFVLNADSDENIKINQIRKLLLFLGKTTYYKGLKIVLIDNAEYLNISSSNALLKAIEEPSKDTFFLIINNDSKNILNTIKSRCINFRMILNLNEKKEVFKKIVEMYDYKFTETDLNNFLYFETHGNLLRFLSILNNSDFEMSEDYMPCISYLTNLYSNRSDAKILNFLTLFIQYFYNQLSFKNSNFINYYNNNLNKIFFLINNMKKFNLDKKNTFFSINKIINNDYR